jgi:hypothetical protein
MSELTPQQLNSTTSSEGFTTLNLSGNEQAASGGVASELSRQAIASSRWFYWIAGLSIINSISVVTSSTWSFLAGLGITQFISGLALGLSESVGPAVNIVAFAIDISIAGAFVVVGYFGQKGHSSAVILGLIFYGLDGLLFLAFGDWFPLAFHAFVFFSICRGLIAHKKLRALEAEAIV